MLGGLFIFVRNVWKPRSLSSAWEAYTDPEDGKRLLRGFSVGAGVTLLASTMGYLLLFVIGGASFDIAAVGKIGMAKISEVIIAALVVPIMVTTEEVMFRGIIHNYLRGARLDKGTKIAAILNSEFLFAFAHGFRNPCAWTQPDKRMLFVGLYLLGVLTALAYEVSASLLPGIGIHAALIWTEVIRARTHIILLDQTKWWMGQDGDPRTAPTSGSCSYC